MNCRSFWLAFKYNFWVTRAECDVAWIVKSFLCKCCYNCACCVCCHWLANQVPDHLSECTLGSSLQGQISKSLTGAWFRRTSFILTETFVSYSDILSLIILCLSKNIFNQFHGFIFAKQWAISMENFDSVHWNSIDVCAWINLFCNIKTLLNFFHLVVFHSLQPLRSLFLGFCSVDRF